MPHMEAQFSNHSLVGKTHHREHEHICHDSHDCQMNSMKQKFGPESKYSIVFNCSRRLFVAGIIFFGCHFQKGKETWKNISIHPRSLT